MLSKFEHPRLGEDKVETGEKDKDRISEKDKLRITGNVSLGQRKYSIGLEKKKK